MGYETDAQTDIEGYHHTSINIPHGLYILAKKKGIAFNVAVIHGIRTLALGEDENIGECKNCREWVRKFDNLGAWAKFRGFNLGLMLREGQAIRDGKGVPSQIIIED